MIHKPIILIVDDDTQIGFLLCDYLKKYHYLVYHVEHASHARHMLDSFIIHCIILDISMPDEDGLSLLAYIRQFYDTPILMLSALGDDTEKRLESFQKGADDFLKKPFEPLEIYYKIESLMKRFHQSSHALISDDQTILFANFSFNTKTSLLYYEQQLISLTITERKILHHLAKNINHDVDREELSTICNISSKSRSIDVYITRLRQKLLRYSSQSPIISVRHKGYKLMHIL